MYNYVLKGNYFPYCIRKLYPYPFSLSSFNTQTIAVVSNLNCLLSRFHQLISRILKKKKNISCYLSSYHILVAFDKVNAQSEDQFLQKLHRTCPPNSSNFTFSSFIYLIHSSDSNLNVNIIPLTLPPTHTCIPLN